MTAYAYPRNKLERRVLVWCNGVRATMGKRPRKTLAKGRCGDARTLIYANIPGIYCSFGGIYLTANWRMHVATAPGWLMEWRRDFDAGKYPHLEG